jgi:drug/metabolite transporter (DMT)-like permease
MLLGIAFALLSAILYNLGVALQALDARSEAQDAALSWALLWRLLHSPRWLAGTALGIVAFVCQALAFRWASVALVQALLAVGLVVLLAAGAHGLHEPVGLREIGWVGGIVAGVALVAWGSGPPSEHRQALAVTIAVVAGLGALALVPWLLGHGSRRLGIALTAGAGLGFASSNVATKLLDIDLGAGRIGLVLLWLALSGLTALVGMQCEMAAFGRRPATRVVPIVFVLQTVVPIVLAPTFLRGALGELAGGGVPFAAGVALVSVAAIGLARSPGVSRLVAGPSGPSRTPGAPGGQPA